MDEIENVKILVVSYKFPFPIRDGGDYSIRSFADLISQIEEIQLDYVGMNLMSDKRSIVQSEEDIISVHGGSFVEVDNRVKKLDALRSLVSKSSYLMSRFNSNEFKIQLKKSLETDYDIVILEHLYLSQYINHIRQNSDAKIILRAQNVETEIWTGLHQGQKGLIALFLKNDIRKLSKFEHFIPLKLDGIVCLTKRDEDFFKQCNSSLKSIVLPIANVGSSKFSTVVSKEFYHLGSMDWRPNLEGIEWLINRVLPRINSQQVNIHLAGKKMPLELLEKKRPGLNIQGEIESVDDFLEDKGVLIVPLRTGGGMRVKIIEAMAHGKAVISTSKGAEGLDVEDKKNIIIADTEEEFANAMMLVAKNKSLRTEIAKNGYEFSQKNFSNLNNIQRLTSFLNKIAQNK